LDRFFIDASGKLHLPVLLKIAPSGGGPTSTGPTALAITDGSNPNHIDPSEAADKLILWTSEIGNPASSATAGNPTDEGALGRALCTDTTGALWVGMYGTRRYYKVDAATGAVIAGPVDTPGHTPYGCQVDANGKLWSVDNGNTLAEIDTNTGKFVKVHNHAANGANYSLSIFNDCRVTPTKVTVYLSNQSGTYIAYDPQADQFTNPPAPPAPPFRSYSVGVDSKGNIISGHVGGRLIKSSPTGTILWDSDALGSTQTTGNLHGIIVDANDDPWAVHLPEDRVVKYGGGSGLHAATDTVPVGIMPYTYGNTPPATCTDTTSGGTTPSCAPVRDKDIRCEPNGGYSYTFSVTNNSGNDMSQILLTPLAGSTFTLSQELFNLPAPLHKGESTTVTVGIGPGKPGEKMCFFLSLMSDKVACCIVQVCPKLPKCGETYYPPPARPSPTVKKRR
jgi:streptogramin lyase